MSRWLPIVTPASRREPLSVRALRYSPGSELLRLLTGADRDRKPGLSVGWRHFLAESPSEMVAKGEFQGVNQSMEHREIQRAADY